MARLLQDSPSLPWRIIRHVIASLHLRSDSLRLILILTCCPVKLGRAQSQCESFPKKSSSGSPANIRMSPCTVCLSAAHGGLNMTHGDFQKKKFLSFKTHAALNMMKPLMVMLYLTWYTAHSFVPCIYGVQTAAP